MSLRQNQNFEFWEEVEASLRSTSFTCLGDSLVGADRVTVSQAFTLWCLVIQDICGESRLRSNRAMRAWIFQVVTHPLNEIVDALKFLSSFWRDYNRDMGAEESHASFKQTLVSKGSIFALVRQVFADVEVAFLRDCNPTMLQCLLTCLEFPCRLTINELPTLLALEKQKYRDLEDEMKTWTYPADTVNELRGIVEDSFWNFPAMKFWPRHGSGVTSDAKGKDGTAKYRVLQKRGLPPRLHHFFCQEGINHPLVNMKLVDKGTSCRVLLVPKGVNSKRVISCEPTANQWFQQSILRSLDEWLPQSCFHITMRDQTRNQHLAQRGSEHRDFATIDLSSASDTVTNKLVSELFFMTPIWPALWASRSQFAKLDGERILLSKFAPMGSAVCFPIESMIFAAVVILAMRHMGVQQQLFVVYGDDIICHKDVYAETVRLLHSLHFSVNEKKTFSPESPFKESCGKEFYYGSDVTPFRIPRFFHGWEKKSDLTASPQLLPGWVSLANGLHSAGLFHARAYLVHRLLQFCPDVPFSSRRDVLAVQSPCADNYHLPERFEDENSSSLNKKKCSFCRGRLVKCVTLSTKTKPGDEEIRYQMLLEEYSHTSREALVEPGDLIQVKAGPAQLIPKVKWVPEIVLQTELLGGRTHNLDDFRDHFAQDGLVTIVSPTILSEQDWEFLKRDGFLVVRGDRSQLKATALEDNY